jgi:hypothetical protein
VDTQQHPLDGSSSQRLRALSRELNERLYRLAQADAPDGSLRLLCECGRCSDEIEVEADDYEEARALSGRLLVKRGHAPTDQAIPHADAVIVAHGEVA